MHRFNTAGSVRIRGRIGAARAFQRGETATRPLPMQTIKIEKRTGVLCLESATYGYFPTGCGEQLSGVHRSIESITCDSVRDTLRVLERVRGYSRKALKESGDE